MTRKPYSRRKRTTTTICDGPMLGSAMLREASWSRANSSWGISQFKRPNDILAASSGFGQRSMTISVSSRILEMRRGCRPSGSCLVPAPIEMPCAATGTVGDAHL